MRCDHCGIKTIHLFRTDVNEVWQELCETCFLSWEKVRKESDDMFKRWAAE